MIIRPKEILSCQHITYSSNVVIMSAWGGEQKDDVAAEYIGKTATYYELDDQGNPVYVTENCPPVGYSAAYECGYNPLQIRVYDKKNNWYYIPGPPDRKYSTVLQQPAQGSDTVAFELYGLKCRAGLSTATCTNPNLPDPNSQQPVVVVYERNQKCPPDCSTLPGRAVAGGLMSYSVLQRVNY